MAFSGTLRNTLPPAISLLKRLLPLLPKTSGVLAVLVGVMVVIGWHGHVPVLVQVWPNLVPMKYNTALGFILCGLALVLLPTRHAVISSWLGGGIALLGLSTLTEYLTGRDLGIDELFFKYYVVLAAEPSARMAPLTAGCFAFLGTALALSGLRSPSNARMTAIGILACIVAMITGVATLGFILGIDAAYGWGSYSRMAVHTAVTFLLLSTGLLVWAWQAAGLINYSFLRWLPVTGSVTLMAMIAVVSFGNFADLRDSTAWRKHTYDVLATAQSFLADIFDLQRGMRGYVLSGQPAALKTYQAGLADAPLKLGQLKNLTNDNASQKPRLKAITDDLNQVIAYSHRLIDTRQALGIEAAIQVESTGEGFAVANQALIDLRKFTDEEQRLLISRSAIAEANFDKTGHLLILGSALAALLLVLASLMAGHAMSRQKVLTKKAQDAERAKSEFLAVMSHEIRTPMNGVIGMTSILADSELTEAQHDYVSTIQTSGEALLTVINEILDFSKIESGRMTLECTPFNLQHCLDEALDLFAVQIRLKHLEAVYLIAPEVPPNLLGDAMRLRQVLVNLIGNAVKFTAAGEIVIQVQRQDEDEKGWHLLFSVADTGIGISREGAEKLFQAFQQVDTFTTRRYGGTGLGLAISKRLTELMGGKMWVESEPGIGSTFFFTALMRAASLPDSEGLPLQPALPAAHPVLIVDDNATNRRILETQLKIWGMSTTAVSTGREALHKLAEQTFAFALLDLQMPELDGVALAREIRKQSQLPLILLSSTGDVMSGRDAALFRFQIPKPIKHSLLFNALLKVAGVEPPPPQAAPEKQFDGNLATKFPLRILLAEDNSINQKVGLKILSQMGYGADLAVNGLRVLEAITQSPYDLILMDIQMPDMDGIDAARLVREKLGPRCPFIVALTAEALEGDRDRFLGLGFDAYLSKPLRVAELQDILQTVSHARGQAAAPGPEASG
jgi:signal transduction histidine kinase/CheY-like chemotaxis protein